MCSGVTDGTVISVVVMDAAPGRWQQMKEQAKPQAEEFYSRGFESGRYRRELRYHNVTLETTAMGGGTADGQQHLARTMLVDGQRYTEQQCYIKALELNDQHTGAWYRLGTMGGGSVDGQQYNNKQCYIKAVEIDVPAQGRMVPTRS